MYVSAFVSALPSVSAAASVRIAEICIRDTDMRYGHPSRRSVAQVQTSATVFGGCGRSSHADGTPNETVATLRGIPVSCCMYYGYLFIVKSLNASLISYRDNIYSPIAIYIMTPVPFITNGGTKPIREAF